MDAAQIPTPSPIPDNIKPVCNTLFKVINVTTRRQLELHHHIDHAINIMNKPVSCSPQICKGRAQDVHRMITIIGRRYLNTIGSRWIFKDPDIHRDVTLEKLRTMKDALARFVVLNVPLYNDDILDHCIYLQWYMSAAIAYVETRK